MERAQKLKSKTSTKMGKFKEAQNRLQTAVEKHVKDVESSSEEEELDGNDVLDKILSTYHNQGGQFDQTSRTQKFIQDLFTSNSNTCLICISKIRRDDPIWNCKNCFGTFHLNCIQRWSKDTVVQQKQRIVEQTQKASKIEWCCPKCRCGYPPEEYPEKYVCFCGKCVEPKYQNFLVPHSCGEICRKNLVPECGHKCLLLCHPGPCPPCPVTIATICYCGSQPPQMRRCSSRGWSCEQRCSKRLSCNKHTCSALCHADACAPCSKKSIQKCLCGSEHKLRDCASPQWQCDKVCNKVLDCGLHRCVKVCHADDCGSCPLNGLRSCPCGRSQFDLPCSVEAPSTCGGTCDKVLECGQHLCGFRCHKDKCGLCLEIVSKACRCGQHSKEIQCSKQYLCDSKCKKMKDCNKHPCNRKCCDGNCPPCEKPCNNSLQCGHHKCTSVCHRGPCFPCQQTKEISCKCSYTKITVPCGRKNRTKPPKCSRPCKAPPDCHHLKRDPHRCHFGDCPPCKQMCNKSRDSCTHPCPVICHDSVLVKVEAQKASMPWEQTAPSLQKLRKPCPDCVVPVKVTCLGGHETSEWPCHVAKPASCGRQCGRLLACTNHTCQRMCHVVDKGIDDVKAGANCEECSNPCTKPRPNECTHRCPNSCHQGTCPPCKQMLRIKCHCGLTQPYIQCSMWLDESKREELQSCGNQCPKNYSCGHRCKTNCHSGPCPNADQCKKKIKIFCQCKRLKKDFQCETIRKNLAMVECDDTCLQLLQEQEIRRKKEEELRSKEDDEKNKQEMEQFEKKFSGRKKNRKRGSFEMGEEERGILGRYWGVVMGCFVMLTGVVVYYALND